MNSETIVTYGSCNLVMTGTVFVDEFIEMCNIFVMYVVCVTQYNGRHRPCFGSEGSLVNLCARAQYQTASIQFHTSRSGNTAIYDSEAMNITFRT